MTWITFACVGLALTVLIGLAYWRGWRWAGFAATKTADGEGLQPAKTLWDWLQLLVIPLALAGLAFLLNNSQSDREQRREDQRTASNQRREDQRATRQREIARDAAREETLRAYLAQMSDFILDRKLLRSRGGSNVQAVGRTATLTALRRLDSERKGFAIQFLHEAHLLDSGRPQIALEDANLRSANLRNTALPHADLSGTDLRQADLREADLRGSQLVAADLRRADLGAADLRRADIREAGLTRANLQGADLRRANLRGAFVFDADLRYADLRRADLRWAGLSDANLRDSDLRDASLRGADLRGADLYGAVLFDAEYDRRTLWPRGFDPALERVKKVGEQP